MELDNITIRSGARLNFTVTQASVDSVSATFIASDGTHTITDTVAYTDGVAQFQFDSPDTDIVGTYQYQINENFSTGSPDKYPNIDECEGGCELPELVICESLD